MTTSVADTLAYLGLSQQALAQNKAPTIRRLTPDRIPRQLTTGSLKWNPEHLAGNTRYGHEIPVGTLLL
jgi:hypothetical protein